jgi:hypothetical protein
MGQRDVAAVGEHYPFLAGSSTARVAMAPTPVTDLDPTSRWRGAAT